MTTTFNINLSAEAPVFNVTIADDISFSVSTVTAGQPLAHKASHAIGGADFLSPADIGAQALFSSASLAFEAGGATNIQLTAARAVTYVVSNYTGFARAIIMPVTGHQIGDIVVVRPGTLAAGSTINVNVQQNGFQSTSAVITKAGQAVRMVAVGTGRSDWAIEPVLIHTHTASEISDFTAAVTAIVNAIRPL